jgi:MoaA/NifB/PqqE/SkfB family radical SAM enzyme
LGDGGVNVYSASKAGWHIDRIADMRAGRQAVPVNLQLIPSDFCQHDCVYCAYRASNGISSSQFGGLDKAGQPTHNPLRMIPTAKLFEILDDASALGVKSITWTGGGEPTAHPDHLQLFSRALDLGLECSLNTNGAVLRKGWQEVLPRFTYVRFSFDGSTPDEYAAIRRTPPAIFQKVLDNIGELVREVKRRDSACIVGVGYVVTPDLHESTPRAVEVLRQTGVAYVRLASMQSTEGAGVYGDRLAAARESVRRARELAAPGFDVIDLFDAALGKRMEDAFCGFQQMVLYIGGNQKVYRCCYVAYSQPGEIGDLHQQRFSEWFASEAKRDAIENFDARSCGTCPLVDKNRTITEMVRTPMHVNFV